MRKALMAGTGILLGLATVPAFANPVPPGSSGIAPDTFGSITGTVVASIMNASFSTSTFSGTYSAVVLSTATGLDFLIQVTNNTTSPQEIATVSTGIYPTSIVPDVGYLTTGSTAGGLTSMAGDLAPSNLARPSTAVNFNFAISPGFIGPGKTSDVLVLETTATKFTAGTIGLIDSTTATVAGFAPTPAVPEPATLALLGTGLLGLGLVRRRRRNG